MTQKLETLLPKDIVWEEMYRPKNLDELMLPEKLKLEFKSGELRNYLLVGQQGTGKTSTALVLTKKRKVKFVDCSSNRSISMIRDEISEFCSIASIDGIGHKVIILDEVDALKADSQQALRGTIEKYSSVARFIATCNYPEKILAPVLSRFTIVNFDLPDKKDNHEQVSNYAKRIKFIATEHGMSFANTDVIALILKKFYPDMRNILQTLQDCHSRGIKVITASDIINSSTTQFDEAFEFIFNESNPVELYKYFSAWRTKEHILISGLNSEFARYVMTKHPQKAGSLGEIAVLSHKYGVESKTSLDLFITLLALIYEITKTLKK